MKPLVGEYSCTLDSKGRFLMPTGLRKQLPIGEKQDYMLNKGLDDCLVLYPIKVWEQELARIQALNMYETKNRAFARIFLSGAASLSLDASDRGLIPKHLAEKVNLSKDIILLAQIDRIEVWDQGAYEKWIADPGYDIAALAEEVMRPPPQP